MGNTDKEQFVKYPLEVCEALCVYHLSPIQFNVINYIIRRTYGWGKIKDYISVNALANKMGKNRSAVSGAVNDLYKKNIIGIERERNGKAALMWVKPPEEWEEPVIKSRHVIKSGHVAKSRHPLSENHDRLPVIKSRHPLSENHDTIIDTNIIDTSNRYSLQKGHSGPRLGDELEPLTEEEMKEGGWGFD